MRIPLPGQPGFATDSADPPPRSRTRSRGASVRAGSRIEEPQPGLGTFQNRCPHDIVPLPGAARLPDFALDLVRPAPTHLPSYRAALERGWSPDTVRGSVAAQEELARIAADPDDFLASLDDVEATGGPIVLPDGTRVPRLPGYRRWIWDGDFCGSIGLRWQPGTADLPAHVLGHIGYSVVPWKQGRGYARRALGLVLRDAAVRGLPHVDLTTDPDNIASQRVIIACGGELVRRFRKPAAFGAADGLLYRIALGRVG